MEEVVKGRMRPLGSKKRRRSGKLIVTRRFRGRQRSSKGVLKLRCVDDVAWSKVNKTNRILRRIRMGKIQDVVAFLQRARKKFPQVRFKLLESDFKGAYRICPIHPSHHKFAVTEVKFPRGFRLFEQLAMPSGRLRRCRLGTASAPRSRCSLTRFCWSYLPDS